MFPPPAKSSVRKGTATIICFGFTPGDSHLFFLLRNLRALWNECPQYRRHLAIFTTLKTQVADVSDK